MLVFKVDGGIRTQARGSYISLRALRFLTNHTLLADQSNPLALSKASSESEASFSLRGCARHLISRNFRAEKAKRRTTSRGWYRVVVLFLLSSSSHRPSPGRGLRWNPRRTPGIDLWIRQIAR